MIKDKYYSARYAINNAYRQFMAYSLRKKIAIVGGTTVAIMIIIPLLTYAYFVRDIANEERLMNRNNTGVIFLDREGEEFHRAYNANASDTDPIPLDDLPDHLVEALIASEDRNFYEHGGYAMRAMFAALYGNILNRDATRFGGSTITQQLAKNALLTNDKNYFRKYQELSLAIAIERHYEKDKILEMYLNSVYYGEGAFGIEDAAQAYFNKPATQLTLAESSILIGILPAPSVWSPISGDRDRAMERQELVLNRMAEVGYLEDEMVATIAGENVQFAPPSDAEDIFAPHFVEMALNELRDQYGEERVARSGFQVTTTLDSNWQTQAEGAVAAHIAALSGANASNGAVSAIDPSSGGIRVLVGSTDWDNEEFGKVNMTTAMRQPGSSFKPIYYAEALSERNITPATIIEDKPTKFGSDNYEPQNFDKSFRGNVTVRRSLANSLNIPSVKIMEELGVDRSIEAANRMGLKSIDNDDNSHGLSLALGTAEVPLLSMTNAYAAFANGGVQHNPTTITSIQNKYGKVIYEQNDRGDKVLDEEASYLITSILADDNARAETFGSSLSIGRPAAVKTGTTEDNRDALAIGYTPDLAVGVWVGNNDNSPMSQIGGSSGAAPIWRNVMLTALADRPLSEFERPSRIESSLVCASNGLRANRQGEGVYREYFIRGTLPSGRCNVPAQPEPSRPDPVKPEEEEEIIEEEEPEIEDEPEDDDTGGDQGEDNDDEDVLSEENAAGQ